MRSLTTTQLLESAEQDGVRCPYCGKRFSAIRWLDQVFKLIAETAGNGISVVIWGTGVFEPDTFVGGPDAQESYFQRSAKAFHTIKFRASRPFIVRLTKKRESNQQRLDETSKQESK